MDYLLNVNVCMKPRGGAGRSSSQASLCRKRNIVPEYKIVHGTFHNSTPRQCQAAMCQEAGAGDLNTGRLDIQRFTCAQILNSRNFCTFEALRLNNRLT